MQRGFARFVLGRAVQGVVFVLVVSSAALLLTQLAPGDYALQVIVTDKLASEKNRVAAQSMDFEVRP